MMGRRMIAILLVIFIVGNSILVAGRRGGRGFRRKRSRERKHGDYIVVFKTREGGRFLTRQVREGRNGKVKLKHEYFKTVNGFSGKIDKQYVEELRKNKWVKYVEEDEDITAADQIGWGIDRMNQRTNQIDGVFETVYSNKMKRKNNGEGINVYVIDSGIYYDHTEFQGRTKYLFDNAEGKTELKPGEDCNGHGTSIAAIVSGQKFGVAKNATIYSVRFMDCDGKGKVSNLLQAMETVRLNAVQPCVVVVAATASFRQSLNDAVEALFRANCVVVVAAGNHNKPACEFSPGSSKYALTVGATTEDDRKTWFSNHGECVDIWAPGENIDSAGIWGISDTANMNGTSAACPHVAGLAALMLSDDKTMTPADVYMKILKESTCYMLKDLPSKSPNRLVYAASEYSDTGICYEGCGELNNNGECDDAWARGIYYNPGGYECPYGADCTDCGTKKATCSLEITHCYFEPCENGGTCFEAVYLPSRYLCTCPEGYVGDNCESEKNECQNNPCSNGGTCVDEFHAFSCVCKPGYTGITCDIEVDECSSNPCSDGGQCVREVNGYYCTCNEGYTGKDCETVIDNCKPNRCMNNAVCVSMGSTTYYCYCQPGYEGKHCERYFYKLK